MNPLRFGISWIALALVVPAYANGVFNCGTMSAKELAAACSKTKNKKLYDSCCAHLKDTVKLVTDRANSQSIDCHTHPEGCKAQTTEPQKKFKIFPAAGMEGLAKTCEDESFAKYNPRICSGECLTGSDPGCTSESVR